MSDDNNSIVPTFMLDELKKSKKHAKKAKKQEKVDAEVREDRESITDILPVEDIKQEAVPVVEQVVQNKFRESTDSHLKRVIDDHNKRHGFKTTK